MKTLTLKPVATFSYRRILGVITLILLPLLSHAQSGNNDKIYIAVQQSPVFPGGMDKFYTYLAQTIHYPAADRNKNIQGRVIATFVVEKDGSLSNIKALKGPSASLNTEATRALASSPHWIPGMQNHKKVRVQYTVPIMFTLDGNKPAYGQAQQPTVTKSLYLVNGVKTSVNDFNKIPTSRMASMKVLSGKEAAAKYGESGKNGVVEVTTKGR
ncbi:TonB family protein [Mucilaginibacter robiniae]|uniref:TonB family protein n=1 Tax=Mucilaginibacter robiniae TaxID=2728022 RepID=A0A7L5E199_9SPHI|nr:energy transducer TonB [Mucilaginibacter robiniae]QJD96278.1 TonB family protein [Mucilaginibacter robiniae]